MKLERTRQESVYLSKEVYWMIDKRVKAQIAGTDASRTVDEWTDCYLRYHLTTDNPELVIAYDKFLEAKQKNRKEYDGIEEEAVRLINEKE